MIYLAVAVVYFFIALIDHIRSPDPDREYSRKDIFSICTTVAVFLPLMAMVQFFYAPKCKLKFIIGHLYNTKTIIFY